MVSTPTYLALVGLLITIGGLVWKAAIWRERSKQRGEELEKLDKSITSIEENMATHGEVSRIYVELDAIRETVIDLHDDHDVLRQIYLNRDKQSLNSTYPGEMRDSERWKTDDQQGDDD